jgi:hypothetical protein
LERPARQETETETASSRLQFTTLVNDSRLVVQDAFAVVMEDLEGFVGADEEWSEEG